MSLEKRSSYLASLSATGSAASSHAEMSLPFNFDTLEMQAWRIPSRSLKDHRA